MAKLTTELLGTALLTFTIAVAAGQGAALAPFAIGSTLMCAIYAGGHISGANYNPAVTLAIFLRGKLGFFTTIGYMLAQLIGGARTTKIKMNTRRAPCPQHAARL